MNKQGCISLFMCEYMCLMDMKINKDIRNKIAQILQNKLQENIETCHMNGNRSGLGKLCDQFRQGRKGENLQRYVQNISLCLWNRNMPDCVYDGSGGGGGSQTNCLHLSNEVLFAVNRNLTTLTP